MTAQGIDVNIFDGLAMSRMIPVHTATSLSAAKMDPVGGFIDGAAETSSLDECFHQQGTIPVQSFPVFGKAMCGKSQYAASKTFNRDVGQHEKATIGNNELKIALPLISGPSDPSVTRRHGPGGAGKLQTSKKLSR